MDYLKDQDNDAYTSSTPIGMQCMPLEGAVELCDMTAEETKALLKDMDEIARIEATDEQAFDTLYRGIIWRPMAFPARPPPRHYPVPLPADTDRMFKIDVTVSGQPGTKLEYEGRQSNLVQITNIVDNATLCLDEEILGPVIWAQRVYFAPETTVKRTPMPTPKRPSQGFTLAHLIEILLVKQRRHWASLKPCDRTLQYFVGTDVIPPEENCTIVRSSLYATAIRRRLLSTGLWCYFFQLEIRV